MKHGSDKFDIAGQSQKDLLRLLLTYQQAIDKNICHTITDTNGTIIYVNNKFCELSKYSKEEVIGHNHRILKSGEHPQEFYQNLWDTIRHGKSWQGEVKNKAKDGTYYWSDTVILPITDQNNNIIQYLALRYPITDRKQLEEEKGKYINSLEEMLFMISHKVRQPIANILGFSNLMDSKKNFQEDLDKIVEYMKQSALSLDTFTKELTTFIYEVVKTDKKKNNR